jgi:plasmid replication initiation protein
MDNIHVKGAIMRVNKGDLVKQHNALICSKHELTQTQMKIILAVIGKIQKEDEDFKDYCFYVKDFLDVINPDAEWKKNYNFIIESIKGILSKPLHIRTEKGDLICNWLAEADTEKDSGLVRLKFPPSLKPYLLQLREQFTTFKLEYILSLNSIYSIRIYELLKQFKSTGVRSISLEEFKRILVIPNSYKISDIKNVLNRAKEEISEKTDIEFTYTLNKPARKVTSITFYIRPKVVKLPDKTQDQDKEDETLRPPEEVAKECYERNSIDGECKFKNFSFKPPYCKFCRINQGK